MTCPRRLALLLSAAVAVPAQVSAQNPVSVTAEAAYMSEYLFAGIPFATGPVSHARISVNTGGLTLYGYGVYDYDAEIVSEADIYGDYYAQLSPRVGAYVGAALYHFKIAGVWEGTPEVYGGLVFAAPLNPSVYVAHDFDLGDGTHVLFGLSHAVPLGAGATTLDLAAHLDYNDGYYVETSSLAYGDVSAALSIPVGRLTLEPVFVVQRGIEDGFPDEEVFGVTASFTF